MADRSYLQHGRRHGPQGSDPIVGFGGAEWFFATRTTSFTMPAGTEDTIVWTSLQSSDSTLFSLGTVNHPNDSVDVARQGVLMVSSFMTLTGSGTDFAAGMVNNLVGYGVVGGGSWNPMTNWTREGLPGALEKYQPRDISLMVMSEIPQSVTARYHNFDGATRAFLFAQMAGFWWPNSVAAT